MRFGGLLFLACALTACASSAGGDSCDDESPCPAGQSCADGVCVDSPDASVMPDSGDTPFADAGDDVDAGITVDAAPKAGFGEPCTDKGDCESNICIFVNTGGICTETCVAGSCPDEFGCFGVFGAIDPGEVADVCVPEGNQLCSPCVDHTECSIIGQDKCVTYDNGASFCARDCATVACPTGYTCQTTDVDGTDYQQCIPNSGACDCNASLVDTTEACSLTTPFGSCDGQRTCQGATGWGGCEPPSASDVPDETFTDDNCDGIDGDYDGGIFVSRDSGADGASCGLDHTDPCATIGQGLIRAIVTGRNFVYVQASSSAYAEVVSMVVGKHIYGGYDANWVRDAQTNAGHKVTISGGLDGAENQYMTIKAHDLVAPTVLGDVTVVGPDAAGTVNGRGKGSYAVHVDNAYLDLRRVSIVAGDGAAGDGGGNGQPATKQTASSGMNGKKGGNAKEGFDFCDSSTAGGGGARGINSCTGGTVDPDGGKGGKGGARDSDCCAGTCSFVCGSCSAKSGVNGDAADSSPGTYGNPGGGGGTCAIGGGAWAGRTYNGAAGTAGSGGFLSAGYWYAKNGGGGGVGDHGTGGGGGGGSGGCDAGLDSYGAGGGGGGAGGCRASSGGGGGSGGGGSFGIFAVNGSTVDAVGCTIARGVGGDGGQGGPGGHGQEGGTRGTGGDAVGDSKRGGHGAAGGHGGHGGGGGGGAGGVSAGLFNYNSTFNDDCTVSGGIGGDGGLGGISAPFARTADADGNDGVTGVDGSKQGLITCLSPSSC